MNISCAHCKSKYILSDREISTLNDSVFVCNKCSKNIKICTCPHCNAAYSITYTTVNHDRYRVRCERCLNEFDIYFKQKPSLAPVEAQTPRAIIRESSKQIQQQYTHESAIANNAGIVTFVSIVRGFYHSITGVNLAIAIIGVVVLMISMQVFGFVTNGINAVYQWLFNEGSLSTTGNPLKIFLAVYSYLLVATAISHRIIAQQQPKGIKTNTLGTTMQQMAIVGFAVVSSLLVFFNVMIWLFTKIPAVNPGLFALMFLPVYAASILIAIIGIVVICFLPSVITELSGSIPMSIKNSIAFLQRHQFSMVLMIPIVIIFSLIIIYAASLLHYGIIELIIAGIKRNAGEHLAHSLTKLPSGIRTMSDIINLGVDSGVYGFIGNGELLKGDFNSAAIGIVISVTSVLLFSLSISLLATVSTNAYLLMVQDREMTDRNKIQLLGVMLLVVLLMIGVKKMVL